MCKKIMVLVSAVLALGLVGSVSAVAADVNQVMSAPSGVSWNDGTVWADGLPPTAENNYFTNGYTLRSAPSVGEDYTDTFNGGTLTVGGGEGGDTGKVMIKSKADSAINVIAGWIFDGGVVESANDGVHHIGGTITALEGGMNIRQRGRADYTRELHLVVPVEGPGPVNMYCDVNTGESHGDVYVAIGSSYSGVWTIGVDGDQQMDVFFTAAGSLGDNAEMVIGERGVADIDYDVAFNEGTLAIQTGGLLILDQNHSFGAVDVGGTSLAAGTYPSNDPALAGFVSDDGGSITVIGAEGCACIGDMDGSGQRSLADLDALVNLLVGAGPPFIVDCPDAVCYCADFDESGQVSLADLDAMVNLLVAAGPPFIVDCE